MQALIHYAETGVEPARSYERSILSPDFISEKSDS